MNQIERLRDDLKRRFPDLSMEIDAPLDEERGSWHLDIWREGARMINVEWRPDRGFGVSTPDEHDYGVGVDEVYPNVKATYDRVVRLVLSGSNTEPPLAVRLAELRQLRGLSQGDLATRVGVRQANVSRIEGRGDDIKVGTLARLVVAMGASLEIVARFPDGTVRELEF